MRLNLRQYKSISVSVFFILFLSLLVLSSACRRETSTTTPDNVALRQQRGEEIVDEYLKRDASPYRRNHVRMTITTPNEPLKVYELEIWRKQTTGETLTVTHVLKPTDESDLAALSIERKGQPAVNVTYVSSTDQFRETGTNKMFFGGLTAQELLGEWDKYSYEYLGDKTIGGVPAFEVEGKLKPGVDSILARSKTLFRSDTYLPAEMHLFSSDGSELRTFQVKQFKNLGGHDVMWATEIQNLARQTKILIETLDLTFPDKADEQMFTREYLKRTARK
jgi:Outer membrane lipoprotein-sorting protein